MSKNGKFQLPTLSPINVSLTDGTNIPPPQDSPDEPRPPTPGRGPLSSHPTTPSGTFTGNGYFGSAAINGLSDQKQNGAPKAIDTFAQADSTLTEPLKSPITSTKRPSSVRRFLGLRSLGSSDSLRDRPSTPNTIDSRTSTTVYNAPNSPILSKRKSTGWFSKRKSSLFTSDDGSITQDKENAKQPRIARGPPPPTIPELGKLDGGDLGADDLFNNIK
ncbi:hypothetical protein EJ05DRAFT_249031 [Pseudovirgaria hyperparasitica]|uniref:Uncharacterized protein n=1 Tax=Pseudovirgaria hyperparasitica TaxID=470096 RepID=A0A6A6WH71_9PEZI|nr:uncharacterized protein EJ05DRAFT_249031 [Pseudovirgaria hyperparasitica]KAF2760997.1 hypothetical protein EJ05DRAFT_249031 [Pseudovirgaria hyperparasitica]